MGPLHPARAGGRRAEPQDLHGALCQHAVQPVRQRRAHHHDTGRWIESQFGDALDSIRAGHSLSEAIAGIDGFEVKLSSSVAVGEETGKLDSLLATISETLDYEAEMATKRLVTLLEPVMIVVMGLVVGGVVAAVIVPIYQSYGTIGASSGAI